MQDYSHYECGIIISIQNSIIHCSGLPSAMNGELVVIGEHGLYKGVIASLDEGEVLISLLTSFHNIVAGDKVFLTGQILSVPVGNSLLGRIVDPLGNPLDGISVKVESDIYYPIEREAPQVMERQAVKEPCLTSIKSIDMLFPIARGQRELIIGDRKTGKTQIAVNSLINQARLGVKCVYVIIGKERKFAQRIFSTFQKEGILDKTVIVFAGSEQSPGLQVISAFAGCALAEYWMHRGEDTLIIYDDLSQHAIAHRQACLALKYSPGREAYPGDLFFLHARLLERAASINPEYIEKMSGVKNAIRGSLTALPILNTQYGDISNFVSTNVISITDGQIVLDQELFNKGIRPAISIGRSVSRLGKAAQNPLLRNLSSNIKIILSQYKELEGFANLASELDAASLERLDKGEKTIELMTQTQAEFFEEADMALILLMIKFYSFKLIPIQKLKLYERFVLQEFAQNDKHLYDQLKTGDNLLDFNLYKDAIDKYTVLFNVLEESHE